MKMVIDIPEGLKDVFENRNVTALDVEAMRDAIKNGTPLPKGHGRLIDADALISEIKDLKKSLWYKDNTNFAYLPRKEAVEVIEIIIGETPIIIEADKEG